MTIRSCTDQVRVKVPSFQKDTLLTVIKYTTDMLSIYILISLKVLIIAKIKDKKNQKFCDN